MIYRIEEEFSLDGRSNRTAFSNTWHLRHPAALESSDIASIIATMVQNRKNFSLQTTHFMNVLVTRMWNDDHTDADGEHRSFVQSGTGVRAVVGNRASATLCARIVKGVTVGTPGSQNIRGALLESDIVRQPDGSQTLAGNQAGNFANLYLNASASTLNAAGTGAWVIPRSVRKRHLLTREIVSLAAIGTRQQQLTMQKTSILSAQNNLHQRQVNEFASRVRKARRDYAATLGSPDVVNFIANILAAAWQFINALTVLQRGALTIPRVLLALPA